MKSRLGMIWVLAFFTAFGITNGWQDRAIAACAPNDGSCFRMLVYDAAQAGRASLSAEDLAILDSSASTCDGGLPPPEVLSEMPLVNALRLVTARARPLIDAAPVMIRAARLGWRTLNIPPGEIRAAIAFVKSEDRAARRSLRQAEKTLRKLEGGELMCPAPSSERFDI